MGRWRHQEEEEDGGGGEQPVFQSHSRETPHSDNIMSSTVANEPAGGDSNTRDDAQIILNQESLKGVVEEKEEIEEPTKHADENNPKGQIKQKHVEREHSNNSAEPCIEKVHRQQQQKAYGFQEDSVPDSETRRQESQHKPDNESFSLQINPLEEQENNIIISPEIARRRRVRNDDDDDDDEDSDRNISIRPGAQRIAGVPVVDDGQRSNTSIVGSIDNLDYLNIEPTTQQQQQQQQTQEVTAAVVDEEALRQELVGDVVQAEIVPVPPPFRFKKGCLCLLISCVMVILAVGATMGILYLRPNNGTVLSTYLPSMSPTLGQFASQTPTNSIVPTSEPSQHQSFQPSISHVPTSQPTISTAPTSLCDSVGLNISIQCDHNIWTETIEECDGNIPLFPFGYEPLVENPLELYFRFNGDLCDPGYPLISTGIVECQDYGSNSPIRSVVFVEFIDGDEDGNFTLSFNEVSFNEVIFPNFLNISNSGTPLPDRLNVTVYDDPERNIKFQSMSFPTYSNDTRPIFLLDRFGSIQIVAYRTANSVLVQSWIPDEMKLLDINIVLTIEAKRRFELEGLQLFTNQFGIINLDDRVNGAFVDSRPTSPLVVGPVAIDLSVQTRYTFFASLYGNLLGELCTYDSESYEFIAGMPQPQLPNP